MTQTEFNELSDETNALLRRYRKHLKEQIDQTPNTSHLLKPMLQCILHCDRLLFHMPGQQIPPPEALDALQEGVITTFANGQRWRRRAGTPERVAS